VASGFTDPIECSEMFRVSFCVGGGKKVRQKYGDGRVLKDLTAALQGLGFEDDKGASCCLASAGSYKYQHNTDTDLKTVHVFPHVTITQQAAGSDEAPKEKGPVQLIVEFDMDVFESSIAIKVQSFGQKKMLLSVLKMVVAQLAEIDQKLMSMEALTPSEDARYNSANQVADKVEWLQQQCQKHVDEGNLTRLEQQSEANNIRAKLEALAGQAAEADGNAKKLKKLDAKKAALDTQLEKITSATPTKITIKHAMDILKLQASARHLGRSIEDNSATMADIKEHSNVLAKIDKLKDEQDEAYWFQDPDLVEKVALPTKKKGGKKGGGAKDAGWSNVSHPRMKSTGVKKKGGGGKSGFAGLSVDD